MDPRLLRYYNRELAHLREMGGEFAREFPKIASRLGLDTFECADPYVERLLEGFAFLAARVQLKIDAEFPRFVQNILNIVYPDAMVPTPSMAVVQLTPDMTEGSLVEGFVVPRHSVLRSILGPSDQTACLYRTGQDVTLWPVELVDADYVARDMSALGVADLAGARSGLRLRLKACSGLTFDQLTLASLPIYLRGGGAVAMRLYEQLLGRAVAVVAQPATRPAPWRHVLDRSCIRRTGFSDAQALLPAGAQSFQGYRLLHEYFAFAERFMFVELAGLGPAMRRCGDSEIDLIVLFDNTDLSLAGVVDKSLFGLHCVPAINLFPKRADRIHLTEHSAEHHLVPDRTRPMDFEVYSVAEVVGYGAIREEMTHFQPLYSLDPQARGEDGQAYYALHRVPRLLSERQQRNGPRSSYIGSELFVSLVDAAEAPYRSDLRQLSVNTMCTNRDLPLHMPVGQGQTDFTMESGAPVRSVRCLAGPTKPRAAHRDGETLWKLLSHLSLNYLSLLNHDQQEGATALREILTLYADGSDPAIRKQIDGVRSVSAVPVVRRVPGLGPITHARGMQVAVTCEESAFEGSGVFLLGAVLEEFLARYVSINSFTETVIATTDRGEVMRWPARTGRRQVL